MTRDRRRRGGAGAAAAGLAIALALSAGCATHSGVSARPSAPHEAGPATPKALADLVRSSLEQERKPIAEARLLPPPPGLDPETLASLAGVSGEKAGMSLDAALDSFRSEPGAVPVHEPLDEDKSDEATRLYISAKQKLLTSDAPGAVVDLRSLLRIDPNAGEAWRQLAEAQLATGAKSDAGDSLRKAEAAGVRDASALEMLGRLGADRGDYTDALKWQARALAANPAAADPLLETVTEYETARSLASLGYCTASRDMLVRMLSKSPSMTASSRYMQEFGAIFRRQGELWREVGDDEMRLGDPGAALAAYEQAVNLPVLDGQSTMPRLVYAAMQAGRPAGASVALVQHLMESGGRLESGDLALLGHVAKLESQRRQLSASLGQLRAGVGAGKPSLAADLTRAQAAVAPPAEARRILAEHLVSHPRDVDAATLMATMAEDPASAGRLAAATATTRPAAAPTLTEGLLRSPLDIGAVCDSLSAQGGPAALLVRGWIELKRGCVGKADETASSITSPAGQTPATTLLRAEAGVASGHPAHATDALASLKGDDEATARARARVLGLVQRFRAALDALEPTLAGPTPDVAERVEDLLLASQLAINCGRAADAERWLRAAVSLDESDDRALGSLLELYAAGGPMPDTGKQAQVVRELRQDHPDGRVLRAARIAEMVRRSAWGAAERDALDLAAEAPGERTPVELLTAIWVGRVRGGNAGAVKDGLDWLDRAMDRRPLDPMLMASKVTLLASVDRSEEAEIVVRKAITDGGGPDMSRLLERLLRDNLKRPEEAGSLALARLEHRERLPSDSLELAEVYLRLNRPGDAATTIIGATPPGVSLLPEQKQRVAVMARLAGQEALERRDAQKPDEAAEAAALSLIEQVAAQGDKQPAEFHLVRLLLNSAVAEPDAGQLVEACDLAVKQAPQLAQQAVLQVLAGLTQRHKTATAAAVVDRLLQRPGNDAGVLFRQWFIAIESVGQTDDLRKLVETAKAPEAADGLAKLVAWLQEQRESDGEVVDARAEVAYVLGNRYTGRNRTDEANKAFELALEYLPTHPWAANNLGYYLADRGDDMPRAAKLIELASRGLPGEPAVLDSLGWLRYKQNVIEDEKDAAGGVSRQGAVSLLEEAAKTPRGQQDATIMNHLGDALWVAGRKTDAQRFWGLAQATASQAAEARTSGRQAGGPRQAPAGDPEGPAQALAEGQEDEALAELKSIAATCAMKRSAAATGRAVRVAPQADNADPQPHAGAETGGDKGAGGVQAAPGTGASPPQE